MPMGRVRVPKQALNRILSCTLRPLARTVHNIRAIQTLKEWVLQLPQEEPEFPRCLSTWTSCLQTARVEELQQNTLTGTSIMCGRAQVDFLAF
jgi:hypothetical protein